MESRIDSIQKLEPQGRFFVLSIGIDAYPKMGKACSTAVAGADAVEQTLCSKYGFELVETYPEGSTTPAKLRGENATLSAIELAFKSLRQEEGNPSILRKEDSLVIYLAGEGGRLDNSTRPIDQRVHFATFDTRIEEERLFLDYATLKRWIQEIPAKHILLISDHCHSGAVDAAKHSDTTNYPLRAQTYESRILLSSGLDEPTDDVGEHGLSTFTGSLVDALENNVERVLPVSTLFEGYYDCVSIPTGQRPACRDLTNSGGHQEGEFFFFLNAEIVANPFESPPFGFGLIDPPRGENLTLADHLRTDIQKYFGWDWFHKKVPCPNTGVDEFDSEGGLLERVISDRRPLVLVGEGGIGKTRLALELCRLAKYQGWDALFIDSSAELSDLELVLAKAGATGRRLILIVDYLEQSGRSLSFDRIHKVTTRSKVDVRVIATCRASHFKGLNELRPKRLNERDCFLFYIPAEEENPYSTWLRSWIEAAYNSIDSVNDTTASRVPAIAVIRKFARGLPHGEDLPDGSGWMAALLMRSVVARNPKLVLSHGQLAHFLACFPMSKATAMEFLLREPFGEVFGSFETDGWITMQDDRESSGQQHWMLGHDLLCDFILRDYLTESQKLMGSRFEAIYKFGVNYSCEMAVATSLGRVAPDVIGFLSESEKLSFFDILKKQFDQESQKLVLTMLEKCLLAPSLSPDQKLQVILAAPRLSVSKLDGLCEILTRDVSHVAYLFDVFPLEYSKMIVENFTGDLELITHLIGQLEKVRPNEFLAESPLYELLGDTNNIEILDLFVRAQVEKNAVKKSKMYTEVMSRAGMSNSKFIGVVLQEASKGRLRAREDIENERRLKLGLPATKIFIGTYAKN